MTAPDSTSPDRFARVFATSEPATARRRWWHTGGRRRAVLAVVVVVVVSVVLATQAFGSSGPAYRVATVTRHDVDATLTGVGTIEPISQATVAFPVAGTVASVAVRVGDVVDVGGTLASLDTDALQQAVHTKEAALAQAELTLSKALAGESVSGTASGSGQAGGSGASGGNRADATLSSMRSTGSTRSGTAAIVLTAASSNADDPELTSAQQAVLEGQQHVDAALVAAETSVQSATTVCAAVVDAPSTASPSSDATSTAPGNGTSAGGGTTNGNTADGRTTNDDLSACQRAIKDALAAQTTLADAQRALVDASTALDTLLEQRAAAASQPSAPAPPTPAPAEPAASSAPTPAPSTPASPQPGSDRGASVPGNGGSAAGGAATGGAATGGNGGNSRSTSPSAADLASYQKAVDAAAAQVAVAQQALAQATIASPIAGTVVAVNLAVGDSVTAGSSTATIVVQGDGGFEVSTTVPIDRITHVAVGQAASVVPDGTDTALAGKVASIGIVPDPDSSTTSYLVRIGLDKPAAALSNGATGTVAIVTRSARSALAVPTSAVTTVGSRHTVEVLDGDTTRRVAVQVGAIGGTWTEITSGLERGQRVVLADVSAALPGSATASSNGNSNPFTNPGFGNRFPNGSFGTGPGR